ncbi:carboxypeptidase M32 [Leptospira perolatii]|uniref:carboxypeptidase M32 n=1 Tax=Leptospira perolatii TaxID=2023191 RepID=UPI000F64500E|nr:carboxypeptidase M32 [Leptospira perolatii]
MWETELGQWQKEMPAFAKYRQEFNRIHQLRNVLGLLHWDMEVTLPADGQAERGEQIGNLAGITHESFTSDRFKSLVEKAKEENEKKSFPGSEIRNKELEVLQKDLDRAYRLPASWVEEFTKVSSNAHSIWAEARNKNDASSFLPVLERILGLVFQKTEYLGYDTEPYDALLEEYEPGARAKDLDALFGELRSSLVPLIQKGKDVSSPFHGNFPKENQIPFNKSLPVLLGLSKSMHRLDSSEHPFSTSLGSKDKRITTRYDESDPISSVFSVLHETGHAMYEAGISEMGGSPSPIKDSVSLGVHESQSRLWENQVGRSKEFWEAIYPNFLTATNLSEKSLPFSRLFSYVNKSVPSLIRVEADQLTYNLHIILRFRIETALFRKEINIKDISSIWKVEMRELLGVTVPDDSQGFLQDVHWSGGAFGYFPTYTLGNIFAAQLFSAFLKQSPEFTNQLKSSNASLLVSWLRENVHSKGRLLTVNELIEKATGEKPSSKYLVEYLSNKIKEQDELK